MQKRQERERNKKKPIQPTPVSLVDGEESVCHAEQQCTRPINNNQSSNCSSSFVHFFMRYFDCASEARLSEWMWKNNKTTANKTCYSCSSAWDRRWRPWWRRFSNGCSFLAWWISIEDFTQNTVRNRNRNDLIGLMPLTPRIAFRFPNTQTHTLERNRRIDLIDDNSVW